MNKNPKLLRPTWRIPHCISHIAFVCLTLFFLLTCQLINLSTPVYAKIGLNVDPGALLIQEVVPGELYDIEKLTKVPFIISNQGDSSAIYQLSTYRPSEAGIKCFQGYLEIPDPSWMWFEKKEVEVKGNSKKKVGLYLRVPAKEEYYNQHWEIAIKVESKPKKGQTFSLAVCPKFQIETKAQIKEERMTEGLIARLKKGGGLIARYRRWRAQKLPSGAPFELTPNSVTYENVVPGKKLDKKVIKLYNKNSKIHTYKITAMSPPEAVRGMFIPWSRGYERMPHMTWVVPHCRGEKEYPRTKRGKPITPLKEITLKPGQSIDIILTLNVPEEEEHYHKRYEGFLFIQPDNLPPGFARIKIKTARKQ